jgi:hypothetical protein
MNLQNAKIVGYFSMPAASLAEQNPDAYNNAWKNAAHGAGTCANCGMGILHHVVVMTPDGKKNFLGQDCAEKIGDAGMREAVKGGLTSEQLEKNNAIREAKILKEQEAIRALVVVQNDRIKKWFWVVEELVGCRKSWQIINPDYTGYFGVVTQGNYRFYYQSDSLGQMSGYGNTFIENIVASLICGQRISERASQIVCEILAKRHGRMGSKNYNNAFDDYSSRLEGISS